MAQPRYPAQPSKPPIARADLWTSIGVLTFTAVFGVVAATMGLFSLAFRDYCPPERCSMITVIQLYRRKPGW
ncbi:MAG TPA: hypothetical protein VE666_07780, partial [Mycobacterium sp.]|nr:hypothetical protein [Mycobacterium sp.]